MTGTRPSWDTYPPFPHTWAGTRRGECAHLSINGESACGCGPLFHDPGPQYTGRRCELCLTFLRTRIRDRPPAIVRRHRETYRYT